MAFHQMTNAATLKSNALQAALGDKDRAIDILADTAARYYENTSAGWLRDGPPTHRAPKVPLTPILTLKGK
jgi:hypothetical protein